MSMRFNLFITIFTLFSLSTLHASVDTGKLSIDIRRLKLHEDIDKQQQILCGGGISKALFAGVDKDLFLALSDLYGRQTNGLQESIETDKNTDHRIKVKYLTGLFFLLEKYSSAIKDKTIELGEGVLLFGAFTELLAANRTGSSLLLVSKKYSYSVNQILFGSNTVFFDDSGLKEIRLFMFRQYAAIFPEKVLTAIGPYLEETFADSLITSAALNFPSQFYDFAAASNTKLGQKVRRINHPLVKLIVRMTEDKSGRLVFPFATPILKGRIEYDSVIKATLDKVSYYKMLVKTQVSFMDDLRKKDTPILYREVFKMISKKAAEIFINEINALHDELDEVRFKVLLPLSAEEMYYIIITGEDVLYTSSYTGVYARMMGKSINNEGGDALLVKVRFDHFRKFIKMAAGYNRLDTFLLTMPDSYNQLLMTAFVRGLDRSFDLEEAVDVADSYGSLKNVALKNLLQREIEKNLSIQKELGNKRGESIYNILDLLFKSAEDSASTLTGRYQIPPAYKLNYTDLSDASGRIIQQVFFYGDKDGRESFLNFMNLYNGKTEWKVTKKEQWLEIKSLIGKPVWIFANLPIENLNGNDADAKAQASLGTYLFDQGLSPSVVIHRGHSYHLKYTINQLSANSKIVILGSCGGFQNLNAVLDISPEAQIVSSKEIGTKLVNEPVLKMINESLRLGEAVNWISIWHKLEKQFPSGLAKERFENYIPPHKNLGALFIKAYAYYML